MQGMKHWAIRSVPNVASALNLFCGASGIASVFMGKDTMVLVFLLLCLVLDVLDGFLARKLDVQSLFGKEIDSLADLVAFGLLPASIVFRMVYADCNVTDDFYLALSAFLIAVGAAIRLAKFNLDTRQTYIFLGLPTPAATVFIGGLFYMQYAEHPWTGLFLCEPAFFICCIVILPILLVSDLPLWSLKALNQRNGPVIFSAFIAVFLALCFILKEAAVPLMVVLYLCFGVVNVFLKIYGDEI